MSRMNEQSQDQEERENLSGSDDCEAWIHEQSMTHETLVDMDNSKYKEVNHGN